MKLELSNLQKFCRTCLDCLQSTVETSQTASVQNYDIRETPDLTKMLIICTALNINGDGDMVYPQSICSKCYHTLLKFKRFREMAIKSQEIFHGIVENTDGVVFIMENEDAEKRLPEKYEDVPAESTDNQFQVSQTELSDSYYAIYEQKTELGNDVLLNNKQIKIENVMSTNDAPDLYDNQTGNSADIDVDRSVIRADASPSSSNVAKKRKWIADDDNEELLRCSDSTCEAVSNSNEILHKHWKEKDGAGKETVKRKKYRINAPQDRKNIVEAANRSEDWVKLSVALGINYKTAYTWVAQGRPDFKNKGGQKRLLDEGELEEVLGWIESDCRISLKEIVARLKQHFQKEIGLVTMNNYLDGQIYSVRSMPPSPDLINTIENKQKRAAFVTRLSEYVQEGKQIVWIDQTNFNLFCRHTRGRSKIGQPGVQIMPAARGPNVHLIGAITGFGVVDMDRRRGSFIPATANEWIGTVIQKWQDSGNALDKLVFVCDHIPCLSALESTVASDSNDLAKVLRLAPYSAMLNPLQIIWSRIKKFARSQTGVPTTKGPGLNEQRLEYLEDVIDGAVSNVTSNDCTQAVQYCSTHYPGVLSMKDITLGKHGP